MKITKRIIAFMLATVILASFSMLNSGAIAEWYDYTNTPTTVRFFPGATANPSFAYASITNWGYDEEDNDLEARTYAYNTYINTSMDINNVLFESHAYVHINFDDGTSTKTKHVEVLGAYDEYEVLASVTGTSLDFWDKCVDSFSTRHMIYQVIVNDGDPRDFDYETHDYDWIQYGNTIRIGTED